MVRSVILFLSVTLLAGEVGAAERAAERIDADSAIAIADDLWRYAELGYLETRSAERLRAYLGDAGFTVEAGVAEIPTAFVASYGRGAPVIGILAEYDALPGMSQAATAVRQPLAEGAPGHACGHHLFGSASAAAGVAVARWLASTGTPGTVRVYGTPAEEGGSGKVYMARAGLFDDVDVVLHWHPGDRNDASPTSSTANKSARFRFHGQAAHAAEAPERGRSALDGVEAMNVMANMMREHMPSDARMHYVITKGGAAPNVVPDLAEVYYYVRHPDAEQVLALFDRLVKAAEGAALGTDTRVTYEVIHGNYALLPNDALAAAVDAEMRALGGIQYTPEERAFAESLYATLTGATLALGSEADIQPSQFQQGMGSTDVGDVSWMTPTIGFSTATWVPGTPPHSWQAVAAGGTRIGHKGMLLAAEVLANTAERLYTDAALRAAARAEFERRRGSDFQYRALLGDRKPPLDYRL